MLVEWKKFASDRIAYKCSQGIVRQEPSLCPPIPLIFTDPSFCPLHTSSPVTQRPVYSAPGVRRPPSEKQTSSHPMELGDRRRPAGLEPGRGHWRLTMAKTVWVHPGDVHFSQDHCHPPPHHLTSHGPAMARMGRKGFSLTKKKLFIPSTFYLQSLNALGNRSLVDIVHRVCGGLLSCPPPAGVGGLLWPERCVPVAYCAGLLPPAVRTDHLSDVHFSQDLCHPSSILYPSV